MNCTQRTHSLSLHEMVETRRSAQQIWPAFAKSKGWRPARDATPVPGLFVHDRLSDDPTRRPERLGVAFLRDDSDVRALVRDYKVMRLDELWIVRETSVNTKPLKKIQAQYFTPGELVNYMYSVNELHRNVAARLKHFELAQSAAYNVEFRYAPQELLDEDGTSNSALDVIIQQIPSSDPRPLVQVVHAPGAAGKTTLTHHLAKRLASNGYIPVFVELKDFKLIPQAQDLLAAWVSHKDVDGGRSPSHRIFSPTESQLEIWP